ncbi:hypothetical protein [Streptomyces sp. NPDC090994]|uniref:hypothetical protein n=1 Tax=Streptomyces sp. NPDC090994 TaxID=3365969 RepID=UPI0038097DD9
MGTGTTAGRTRWWLVAAIAAVPALALLPFLVGFLWFVLSDGDDRQDRGAVRETGCARALAFGGAALPSGARTVGACEEFVGLDLAYRAEFRMPRADVRGWLAHTYPAAPAPGTESCPAYAADQGTEREADLCLDLGPGQGLPDGVEADAVQIGVVAEDGTGTALVRFSAFTV